MPTRSRLCLALAWTIGWSVPAGARAAAPAAAGSRTSVPARQATGTETAGDSQRGLALVRAAAQAMGGADKLTAATNVIVKGDLVLTGPAGKVRGQSVAEVVYPDKIKSVTTLPMGRLVQAYDGRTAWVQMGGQTQELPAAMHEEMERSILTSGGIGIVREVLGGQAEAQAVEPVEVDGRKADVVLWRKGSHEIRLVLDAETHLVSRLSFRATTPQGPADIEVHVSDYRDVGGIQIPWKVVGYQNGEEYLDFEATDITLNAAIDPAVFGRP